MSNYVINAECRLTTRRIVLEVIDQAGLFKFDNQPENLAIRYPYYQNFKIVDELPIPVTCSDCKIAIDLNDGAHIQAATGIICADCE